MEPIGLEWSAAVGVVLLVCIAICVFDIAQTLHAINLRLSQMPPPSRHK